MLLSAAVAIEKQTIDAFCCCIAFQLIKIKFKVCVAVVYGNRGDFNGATMTGCWVYFLMRVSLCGEVCCEAFLMDLDYF